LGVNVINYDIDFVINKNALIKICLDINIKSLLCCQDTNIILLKNNKRYLLSFWPLRDNMNILKNMLKNTLQNQYQLHPSINEDIGFLYNQDLQDKGNLVYEYYAPTSENKSWVGDRYSLWNGDFATWLYNDSYGNIILHLTSTFHGPWGGDDFDELVGCF